MLDLATFDMFPTASQPPTLVAYLFNRRETILNKWRTACELDPNLPQVAMLSREEFNNLMTIILEILEQQLLGKETHDEAAITAASHGLHRWQKAHSLSNLIHEINHLSTILGQELMLYAERYSQVNPHELLQAQFKVDSLMRATVLGSVSKYDDLQRLEAAGRLASIQQILEQTDELSRQRGELLRTTSHDLRGGFSIIKSAAQLINLQDITPEERLEFQQMLNRNLHAVSGILTQLMDLSRLEAGQDPLQVEEFDVAQLLGELVESVQSMAKERGLFLQADGPASLLIQTDRLKLYRIAQNLVVNALNYTPSGMVSVSWSSENDWRWVLSVQDSGPGLPDGLLEIFHQQLKPTVEQTSTLSPEEGQPDPVYSTMNQAIPEGDQLTTEGQSKASRHQTVGEGVGLLIVKRLSELIGASLEIESIAGRGTLFRLRQMIHSTR
jgi:signal transduction histidine kinase